MKGGFQIGNIVYELTGACNQCCRFCYNYWRDGSSPIAAPDPSTARRTLRKLLSQASVGTISFSGGEPMLLKNIHDMAMYARMRGSHVNILTNGTLLGEDAVANFVSLGVGAIQIPLLSAESSIHDHLTSLPGSWEKARAALSRVVSALPQGAYAVLVITKVNAPGVTATLKMIRETGVHNVMVNRFNIGGMGIRNLDELSMDLDTLKRAFADVEAFAAAAGDMHIVSGVCTPACLLDQAEYPHILSSWCSTDFSRRPVAVSWTGDVRFCNHSPHVLGNIHKRPIGEILTDPEVTARYAAIPEKCSGCDRLSKCNGGCRAASEQLYGTFSLPDPILGK
ncbi:MAG: radical SAM protein [Bacteroidales bacterium]|nr:radical SAM protein [Bacteroidales bacterium]